MTDLSHLDNKYFVDDKTYSCPFCNRRNVKYSILGQSKFDWSANKKCWVLWIRCSSCRKTSAHFSYSQLAYHYDHCGWNISTFYGDENNEVKLGLDDVVFHSIPSSFAVIDTRIPKTLRELVQEGEGCMKMNFLTGASACVRKAIYEFQLREKADGDDYKSRIKSLKSKFPEVDPVYFDILSHIQDMTSEKVHEQSWDKWDAKHLKLFLETLKKAFHEIYVIPKQRQQDASLIRSLQEQIQKDKKRDTAVSKPEMENVASPAEKTSVDKKTSCIPPAD